MSQWLKQSTAADVLLGPFTDDTDFKTDKTALTISQADIRLSKNGAAFAQTNNSAGATHREAGHYLIPLDTTDTNTLGRLRVAVHESAALHVWQDFMVVPANVWDSMFGADMLQVDAREWLGGTIATPTVTGVPEVDLTHMGGVAQSAADLKDFADDGYDPSTNKVQGVVLTDTVTTYTGNTPQTGDSFARLGAPAGASVSADIAAIEAQTDDIGTAGAGLTAVPWNAAWDAEVESEVNDALVAQRLDELLNADSDIDGAQPPTVGSVFHETLTKTTGSFTYDQTTDSLEAIRDNQSTPPTAAAIADQVWEEAIADHSGTVGSTAEALAAAGSAGDPWATAVPGAYGAGTAGSKLGRIPDIAAGASGGLFIAGSNAATTVNVTGNITGNLSGSVGSVTGAVGSVTGNVGGNVTGSVASVTGNVGGNVVGSVASVTGNVGGNVTGSIGSLATQAKADVNAEVDTALADYDAPTSAELVTEINSVQSDIAALNNLSAAQVNAEIVDALTIDTYSEPGQEAPGVNIPLARKIGYIYKAFRNRFTQTATEASLFADNATTVDQKATVSDDGTTFDRGEMQTGP